MHLHHHPPEAAAALVAAFEAHNLIYGAASGYSSLVAPISTVVTPSEALDLADDLGLLWQFYRAWNELYLEALDGHAPFWIARLCEGGLTPPEVAAQRLTARTQLEPRFGRVDYVALGAGRKVAEVQWKSGGLGLFFGMQDVYRRTLPPIPSTPPLGDPVAGLRALALSVASGTTAVAANGVRSVWLRGEHYLKGQYAEGPLRYIPFLRNDAPMRLVERRGRFALSEGPRLYPIDFFYGQESLKVLPKAVGLRLAEAAVAGRVWVETPLNSIYRQKWGMALPFLPAFSQRFPAPLRAMLIPSALVLDDILDLGPLLPYLDHPEAERLRHIRSLLDLAELPTSLRRALVIKCGAGGGPYASHGKGVFRIAGSRSTARRALELVRERVLGHGEPWIVQQYIDHTLPLPVAPPWSPLAQTPIDAHARFMIFGTRLPDAAPTVIGGLGNYGASWKVSGQSPGHDEWGRLTGTAFTDVRVGRGDD